MPEPDDDELELEGIDPEILQFERQMAEEKSRRAQRSVDVNEVFDEQQPGPLDLDVDAFKGFRFTTRHLLVATALLAILMTVYVKLEACNTIFLLTLVLVASGWYYVWRQEQIRAAQRERRKAEREAMFAAEDAGEEYVPKFEPPETPSLFPIGRSGDAEPVSLSISFSMKELFGAFTFAAILLSLLRFTSDMETTAMILGFIALVGLAVPAFGYEAPRSVVLGWWLLMVMYLIVGAAAALTPG